MLNSSWSLLFSFVTLCLIYFPLFQHHRQNFHMLKIFQVYLKLEITVLLFWCKISFYDHNFCVCLKKSKKTMVAAEGEILPRLALIDNTFQQKQKSSQKKQRWMYKYTQAMFFPCVGPVDLFLVSWKKIQEYSMRVNQKKVIEKVDTNVIKIRGFTRHFFLRYLSHLCVESHLSESNLSKKGDQKSAYLRHIPLCDKSA